MQGALTRLEYALSKAVVSAISSEESSGIGTDIVSVQRIRRIRSQGADSFDSLTFTPAEIAYCRAKHYPDIHFAGHLAAKEAVYKALRLNWDMAFSWRFLQVLHHKDGSPYLSFAQPVGEVDALPDPDRVSVSIAHTPEYAIAVAYAPRLPNMDVIYAL